MATRKHRQEAAALARRILIAVEMGEIEAKTPVDGSAILAFCDR